MTELITCYKYNKDGYYDGPVLVQVINDQPLMPSNCVQFSPSLSENSWYKINENKDAWVAELKPTKAEDCVNLIIKHEDNSSRGVELKQLFKELCAKEPEHYKVKRDNNLSWYVERIPEKTLEELKADKVLKLANEAGQYDQFKCNSMYIISSVKALKINADVRSQNNIRSLIEHYIEPVVFKTFDNSYETLTKEQLETLLLECVKNGESLYQQKWAKQQEIANAKTKEELRAIEVQLNMTDFSAQL